MSSTNELRIPEYYRNKNVFITGGTGFMGKVLIEKLLRSCPDIGNLYVLTRTKRGDDMQTRWDNIAKNPLFERLHNERPGIFDSKVKPIAGDMLKVNLGLSLEDRQLLEESIQIIYHIAATVKFDQPLKEAIFMNARGTRDVCQLALHMKQLEVMVHISTAYAHTQHEPIEEELYPPYANWQQCIEIAEQFPKHDLQVIMGKFMEGFPNTYTFTKSLAENIVYDMLNGKVPNIIIRPSIDEPIPGWSDNFNGPFGIFIANSTGLVRINLLDDMKLDFVAVDSAIKGFILATWVKHEEKHLAAYKETTVYNCSSNEVVELRMYEASRIALDTAWECSLAVCVWYPSLKATRSVTIYYIYVLLFHLIPALFFDAILQLIGKPKMVWKIQRKIYIATMALRYFTTNEWRINNKKMVHLENHLSDAEFDEFGYNLSDIDLREFFFNSVRGSKMYLLKENMEDLPKHRRRIRIVYVLDIFCTIIWYLALIYLLFYRWTIHAHVINYIDALTT